MVNIGPVEVEVGSRSGRWRVWLLVAVVALGLAGVIGSEPAWASSLKKAIKKSPEQAISLADHAQFDWDRVHIFGPYSDRDIVDGELGAGTWAGLDTEIELSDNVVLFVFRDGQEVVESHDFRRSHGDFTTCLAPEGLTPQQAQFAVKNGGLALAAE